MTSLSGGPAVDRVDERAVLAGGKTGRAVLAAAAAFLLLAVMAPAAWAAYGDGFGIAAAEGPAFPGTKAFYAGTCDLAAPVNEVGTAPSTPPDCLDIGVPNLASTPNSNWVSPPAWRLAPTTAAGAHPDAGAAFWLNRDPSGGFNTEPDGSLRDADVALPAGFVGNPAALPKCPSEGVRRVPAQCPPETQVGIATVTLTSSGFVLYRAAVYNAEPRKGFAAEFVISNVAGLTNIPITAEVRTDGDFGVTTMSARVPTGFPVFGTQITLWGVPWAASHDRWRIPVNPTYPPGNVGPLWPCTGTNATGCGIPPTGLAPQFRQSYDPSWGPIRPFLSNPTECTGQELSTSITMNSWQHPETQLLADSSAPPVSDCGKPPFEPSATFAPSSAVPDSASGLAADIVVPANDDPPSGVASNPDDATGAPAYWKSDAGRATSQLDKVVVTLPDGLAVNPSAATGLRACSDAQVGVTDASTNPLLFNNEDPFDEAGAECPAGSVIGTAEATTPVLGEKLSGHLVLGTPQSTDPASGKMFRLFLVLRNRDRGLLVKVFGSAVADPRTGRLTATFDKNPRVPVSNIHIDVKGGARGVLATPKSCGEKSSVATLSPWTAAWNGGGVAKTVTSAFTIAGDCSNPFSPGQTAEMSTSAARQSGAFGFKFSREDGSQYLKSLTVALPAGLLASVKGLVGPNLCSSAQAAAGACPSDSRIGSVDASAGSGTPFVLERKGSAYLTEGYKGCAYGLLVSVPAVAGPFDATSPETDLGSIDVRQAVCVDPTDAQVTVLSDPLPEIWHGIPLRVRSVTVSVDRPGFMVNPSGCSAKEVRANLTSIEGTTATRANHFQATGCAALSFRPAIALAAVGRNQVRTGTHPRIKAVVRQTDVGEAGIEKAVVRLPKSLALDPDNAQALCEFEDGTKPDLENRCPAGSIVGRARAKTPLLNNDLVGNVYFVKNVRKDPTTGNLIRTLPMIVVALRGEIAVNLKGESSTTGGGKLVNTFASVPDAPISQFNLNIAGGKSGILAVTRTRKAKINLCASRQIAEVDTDGHNGRQHDFDVRIKTPCAKKPRTGAGAGAGKRKTAHSKTRRRR